MNLTEIRGDQVRGARQLLGLSQHELARRAGINRISLRVYESWRDETVSAQTHVLGKLTRYLEGEGIEFRADGTVALGKRPATPGVSAVSQSEAIA